MIRHVLHVAGARPNFMKVAPVLHAIARKGGIRQTLVHTGQHYDPSMSARFFDELSLPAPDFNLAVGSGSHALQTAEIMRGIDGVLDAVRPDVVLVYGDVNSTLGAALVAAKRGVPIAHVEAGLRSGDRTMPEEINRLVTDRLSRFLYTPSADADAHLAAEGIDPSGVVRVGNVMIDTLVTLLPRADASRTLRALDLLRGDGLPRPFVLVTLHRPSNVDDPVFFRACLSALGEISTEIAIVFPVHPRARQRMMEGDATGVHLIEPLGYLEFLALERAAACVVTDSGGVQEETTYLGVPCITVRENTERPVTVTHGTNVLVGRDLDLLKAAVRTAATRVRPPHQIPDLWDGKAASRIAEHLAAQ